MADWIFFSSPLADQMAEAPLLLQPFSLQETSSSPMADWILSSSHMADQMADGLAEALVQPLSLHETCSSPMADWILSSSPMADQMAEAPLLVQPFSVHWPMPVVASQAACQADVLVPLGPCRHEARG